MGAKLGGGKADKFDLGQNSEINVTPFVDVMMVLLIIFMVAVPLATKAVKLDFPPVQDTNVVPEPPVYISVQASGIFIGDQPTTSQALARDLIAKIGKGTDSVNSRVFVRADADVPYEDFMAVMNTLKANKFSQIGLIGEDIT